MRLQLPTPAAHYKSPAQRIRVASEPWAEANLYCPHCPSPKLHPTDANTEAIDFRCPRCDEPFQLKSQGHSFGRKIVDAAYAVMIRTIEQDRTPNLFALHYDPEAWKVENLVLVPRFAFSKSAIERRRPLASTARRAGWVGCNILLDAIPGHARINVIHEGSPLRPADVRACFARLRPLAKLNVQKRGWTLDVLNAVQNLGKQEFDLLDVYAAEENLARLHPDNRHIRPKIRQQLQVLRDLGFLHFLGRGRYRLR